MKTGKLSGIEKAKILDLFKDKKSAEDIAKVMDRSVDNISKYLEDMRIVFEKDVEEIKSEGVNPDMLARTAAQLSNYGLSQHSINQKINRILSGLSDFAKQNLTSDVLTNHCLSLINASDLMINKTGGGAKGVAAMTEAASQKGDDAPKTSNVPSPHVYKIY